MIGRLRIDSEIINDLLSKLHWTNRRLAEKVGVTPETISRWKAGQKPDMEHFLKLHNALKEGICTAGLLNNLTVESLVKKITNGDN